MSEVTYRSDMSVTLVDHMGSDQRVCEAARVSTKGADSLETAESEGLISYLMRNQHMSPFEHCTLTVLVEAPIFVWREHMRHRSLSYNEESGRYRELKPVFYVPTEERPLVQVGKAAHYVLEHGHFGQVDTMEVATRDAYQVAWTWYQEMLTCGIAREVARNVLPVSIYSSAYVTGNLRNFLGFCALRSAPEALYEIRQVSQQYEAILADLFPLSYAAWKAQQ